MTAQERKDLEALAKTQPYARMIEEHVRALVYLAKEALNRGEKANE